MIFALLFFSSFVAGLICYLISGRWWLGGLISGLILVVIVLLGWVSPDLRGVALYFGIPIVFLGCLFGAYVVQLRRAPKLEESSGEADASSNEKTSNRQQQE